MEIIGLIAEYNPFHNGHLYQIEKIKKLYPDSIIVLVLNGYFLERGEMSVLSKEDKTKLALEYGINIVIELPVIFGCQAADVFAEKSIKLLNELKITKLIFGSESNSINILEEIARKQLESDLDVKRYLNQGFNYPTALKKALNIEFDYNNPNDLLGICYIKSIIKNKYQIKYENIKRTSDYHDKESNEKIISASNIRNKLKNNEDISKFVPYDITKYNFNLNDNMFKYLKYEILTNNNLDKILSVDEGLDYKLRKEIHKVNSLEDLIKKAKSKRYTYNRINRMFTHILLNILKEDAKLSLNYVKVLGFDKKGKQYLNSIKKEISLPIYSNKIESKVKDYELRASLIYDLLNNTNTYEFEIKNKPLIK